MERLHQGQHASLVSRSPSDDMTTFELRSLLSSDWCEPISSDRGPLGSELSPLAEVELRITVDEAVMSATAGDDDDDDRGDGGNSFIA